MKTVYGIVTILDERENAQVYQALKDLVDACGLPQDMLSPVPHFTWHVAAGYQQPEVDQLLQAVTIKAKTFRVAAFGLGLFTGATPVLHVPIMKKIRMIRFHSNLYKKISPLAQAPSKYYTPDNWIPHITIAQGIELPHYLACALERLAYQEIRIDIKVNHLALGYLHVGESWGISNTYDFSRSVGSSAEEMSLSDLTPGGRD